MSEVKIPITEETEALLSELKITEEELKLLLPYLLELLKETRVQFTEYAKDFRELIPSEDGFFAPMEFVDFTKESSEEKTDLKERMKRLLAAACVTGLTDEELENDRTAIIIESLLSRLF